MVNLVDPHGPAVELPGDVFRGRHVFRPDGGGQAVWRIVRPRNDVVDRLKRHHGQQRPKGLLGYDRSIVGWVIHNAYRHEVTWRIATKFAARNEIQTAFIAVVDQPHDTLELASILHRTKLYALQRAIADTHG